MKYALVLLAALLVPNAGAVPVKALGTTPHSVPDACSACHEPGTPAGPTKPIVTNCLSCHPTEDHHPVNVAPGEIKVAAGWPLENGKMTCATCHDEHPDDQASTDRMLRGGHPATVKEFCYRCHESTVNTTRQSPHPTDGKPAADGSCSACHSGRPAAGATLAESRLRLEPTRVCVVCHEGEVHTGTKAHLGKQLERPIDPKVAAEFPLTADGTIACWTCHDVHNSAVNPPPAPRRLADALAKAVRGGKVDAPLTTSLLALPVSDGSLCRACHGNGPS